MKHSFVATNLSKRIALAAVLMAGVAAAPLSNAHAQAAITWTTPVTIGASAPVSDIVNTNVVYAGTVDTAGVSINGVSFQAGSFSTGTETWSNMSLTNLSGVGSYTNGTTVIPTNTAYANLIIPAAYSASYSESVLTFSALTVGQKYLIQIFSSPWDTAFLTNLSDEVGLTPDTTQLTNSPNAQWVTGTFTAVGSTESVYMDGQPYVQMNFSAASLSTVGASAPIIPEPAELAILGSAVVGLLVARRRKANKA